LPRNLAQNYAFKKEKVSSNRSRTSWEKMEVEKNSEGVKERLEKLRDLYDEGLISEEDFHLKKQDVLDSL